MDREFEVKQQLVREYSEYSSTFIETGTASALTAYEASLVFNHVYTIELDFSFYLMALEKFLTTPNVDVLYGDSPVLLNMLMYNLRQGLSCVILLDAHYVGSGVRGESGDTPVVEELEAIFKWNHSLNSRHFILIDDARVFDVDPAYPTIDWIKTYAKAHGYCTTIKDDVIRLHPMRAL